MFELERLVKELYSKGINVNQYLRKNHPELGEDTIIRLSYDIQAGSYAKEMSEMQELYDNYASTIADKLIPYIKEGDFILDAGCGEFTASHKLIEALPFTTYLGLDGSLSRLLAAKQFLNHQVTIPNIHLDLLATSLTAIPLRSSSVDLVFTSHAIEPNSTNSSLIIQEIARVSKKYVALFEPCYEDATDEMKSHMDKHNYARGIQESCERNGLKLLFKDDTIPSVGPIYNKTTFFMYEKSSMNLIPSDFGFITPDKSRHHLVPLDSSTLVCRETEVLYPSFHGVRAINPQHSLYLPGSSLLI